MAVLLHYLLTLPVLGGLAEGGDGTVCPSETSLGQIRDRLSLCGGGEKLKIFTIKPELTVGKRFG